jgi:hypothetical protein
LGMPAAAALEHAGARVLGLHAEIREGEKLELLGFSHGGGSSFIDDGGLRPSSRTSSNQQWIGCLAELHRAALS